MSSFNYQYDFRELIGLKRDSHKLQFVPSVLSLFFHPAGVPEELSLFVIKALRYIITAAPLMPRLSTPQASEIFELERWLGLNSGRGELGTL